MRVFLVAPAAAGVLYVLSEGAAAGCGFVLMWWQEWAVVDKAYNALYRDQGLHKVVSALVRAPAVPANSDRALFRVVALFTSPYISP